MNNDQVKICYIGGGSRNWAWVLMQDLAFEKDISGVIGRNWYRTACGY